MTNLILKDTQQVQLTASFTDKKGQPTNPDNPPVWASSDPTVATVDPGTLNTDGTIAADPTGLNGVVKAVGVGTCQINLTATNNDKTTVAAAEPIQILPGEAVSASLSAGTPAEQPGA